MTRALKFWGLATNIIDTGKNNSVYLTEFGEIVKNEDLYIENDITKWLMHYYLVSSNAIRISTSWYWLFNVNHFDSISYEDYPNLISKWIKKHQKEIKLAKPSVASHTLKKDIKCVVDTYTKIVSIKDPENNLGSPLASLGLITSYNKKFKLNKLNDKQIPLNLFIYALLNYAKHKSEGKKQQEVQFSIQDLMSDTLSPGRIFRISINGIYELLAMSRERIPTLNISRTAGLDLVSLILDNTHEITLKELYK